ncbi:hypothetical protein DF141_33495 [Burkholderia cenocepacia]|nr:hypothetical protein DF141_33495 [Burkholderia cenocepacia]RQV15879.1 hypothetical protein DF039_19190 [Burkholderia cenocepacia]RQZ83034.1 hypothetical protein DF058_33590 [Burkholderia cenocepacia]RRA03659.1 hypothetical protein DF059_33740 [Burkholderia cenocepacia]
MEITRRRSRARVATQGSAGFRRQCAAVNRGKFGLTRAHEWLFVRLQHYKWLMQCASLRAALDLPTMASFMLNVLINHPPGRTRWNSKSRT